MNTRTRNPRAGEAGFSLIEILVGVAIGLLGIIIMMQVLSLAQGTQRTTTSGGDAQNNAFIALDTLQRDITHAGNGFAHRRLLNCNIQLPNGAPVPLAPVIINPPATVIPAGDAGSDRFLVAYGTGHDQPDGYVLDTPSSGPGYTTTSSGAIAVGDWMIHAPDVCPLTLRRVTAHTAATTAVTVNAAAANSATALFNLGAAPRFLAYAVRAGTLAVCDYMVSDCSVATAATLANENIWRPVINNVASLRLQYGRDTSAPMDGIADTFDQTTPADACGWTRTSAVRIALVTRGTHYDRDVVTASANPPWLGDPDTIADGVAVGDGGAGSAPLTLSGVTNWDHYRYRVFQTVIPLRNVAWMGVVSGC